MGYASFRAGWALRRERRLSEQLILVDHELELQTELFGGLAAEDHAIHEYLEVFHHAADVDVDLQLQLDKVISSPP